MSTSTADPVQRAERIKPRLRPEAQATSTPITPLNCRARGTSTARAIIATAMAKQRTKISTKRDVALLAQINAVPVTKADLLALVEDAANHRREDPDADPFWSGMARIVARADGNSERAFALWQRMSALARFVEVGGARGWTLPKSPDGGIWTKEEVFGAAAVHPMIQRGNEWIFDRDSFLERVLALAKSEGTA
jgi:hypothetical protein